jgi:hypothetical protein
MKLKHVFEQRAAHGLMLLSKARIAGEQPGGFRVLPPGFEPSSRQGICAATGLRSDGRVKTLIFNYLCRN